MREYVLQGLAVEGHSLAKPVVRDGVIELNGRPYVPIPKDKRDLPTPSDRAAAKGVGARNCDDLDWLPRGPLPRATSSLYST